MIDNYTLKKCKKDRQILQLKIKNLEYGIQQAEAMIAESQINDEALIFLRKKIAMFHQDLSILYLIKESSRKHIDT